MFTISTKGDYGMLFMVELAKEYKKGLVSLSDFAKRKKISSSYLHQIVMPLTNAGLILSKEGITGGYSLKAAPSKISVLTIIEILEGPLQITGCAGTNKCPRNIKCGIEKVWTSIQDDIRYHLEKRSLTHILKHLQI